MSTGTQIVRPFLSPHVGNRGVYLIYNTKFEKYIKIFATQYGNTTLPIEQIDVAHKGGKTYKRYRGFASLQIEMREKFTNV